MNKSPTSTTPAPSRILVAEASPTVREVTRALLTRSGYAVDLAPDGAEALRLAFLNRYDLILMDIDLPAIDGVEAATMIRALDNPACATPIVAMTAETASDRIDDIRDAGVVGVLRKPFGPAQLYEAISSFLPDETPTIEKDSV